MKRLHFLLLLIFCFSIHGNANRPAHCTIDGNEFYCIYMDGQTIGLEIRSIGNPQMVLPDVAILKVKESNDDEPALYESFIVTYIGKRKNSNVHNSNLLRTVSLPYTISAIGEETFSWFNYLTSISCPNVQLIGDKAFYGCSSLTSISCPDVQSIGDDAFMECSSLKSMYCPNVLSIGSHTFEDCTSLTSISFPKLTSIDWGAFCRCTSLTNLSCPNLTSIENGAFSGCSSLTTLSLPKLQSIGWSAFHGCTSLINISCPKLQYIKEWFAFRDCTSLISVSFPNLKSIGTAAFSGCTSLKSISCPNLQSIESLAFDNCHSLTNIACPNVQSIEGCAFFNCTSLSTICFPNVKTIGESAFQYCAALDSIIIDNEEPPTVFGNTFADITYKTAQLNVPESAVERYKNTWPWSRFYITAQNYPYTDFYEEQKRRDEEVMGVTADGKSQLLIVEKDFPENEPLADYSVVVKIDGEEVKDKKLIGEIGELKYLKKDEVGFVYTAPDGYAGPDNSSSYALYIEFKLRGKQKGLSARVEVWRPGVLMLHGLNDNAFKCWNDGLNYLLRTGSYTQSQINNASYQSSNKASFYDNTYKYKIVEKNLKALYDQLKASGIVSSRYDLVGHSMGGILSRKYTQEINHDAVNRILTFNTPHSGSQYGDLTKNTVDILSIASLLTSKSIKTALFLKGFADTQIPAVYDLGVNSNAIRTLNDPSKMSNAYGIPVHAACSAFDGTDELPTSNSQKTAKPIDKVLGLWVNRMKNGTVKTNLVLDIINNILETNYHDGVVPLTSQRGGLTVGSTASLLTDKYRLNGSIGGFDSNAHHCNITHWGPNHQRLLSLLRASKDDSRFAKSFAPVNLSSKNTKMLAPTTKTIDAKPESFIKITATQADTNSRLVNIKLEASDDVINKGAFCILDEDRVILSDLENECTFSIPSDFEGKLEIIGLGYTSYDAWVTDGAELDFEGIVKPAYICIDGSRPLALSEGESVEPRVTAYWFTDDWSTMEEIPVNASFELVDCDGEAVIENGLIIGLREGSCRLVAAYREMTDTIPVQVMRSSSGIEEITMTEESVMKMFRRDNQIVVRMADSYDGTLDFKVFDLDGRLITRNVTGGYFEANEDILFSLPNRQDSFMIVRCRREDGETVTMKIFY